MVVFPAANANGTLTSIRWLDWAAAPATSMVRTATRAAARFMPAPIVEKLTQEMRVFINDPETRKRYEVGALLAMDASGPTLMKLLNDERTRWTAFVAERLEKQKQK